MKVEKNKAHVTCLWRTHFACSVDNRVDARMAVRRSADAADTSVRATAAAVL